MAGIKKSSRIMIYESSVVNTLRMAKYLISQGICLKLILAAFVTTVLLAAAPGVYAFQNDPEYVYHNGKPMAEMQVLVKGEELEGFTDEAGYTLDDSLIEPVKSSTAYWTGMLGPKAKNETPWQIFVTTQKNRQNASATTASLTVKEEKLETVPNNLVAKQLQNGKKLVRMTEEIAASKTPPKGDYGFSVIFIGQYLGAARKGTTDGWWVDADTVLPTNDQAADFVGTFRHELGHALGISLKTDEIYDLVGEEVTTESKVTGETMKRFRPTVDDPESWNLHLVDQNLNPAKPGMEILSASAFAAKKKHNDRLKESDFFIVNNKDRGEDSSGRNGKAFFIGDHVTEALNGATFFGVSGLPVNTWEDKTFEGAHLQTTGMMSHRDYSNYTSFMEVELAVMQDMGYDIDRKAYFGYSVYGDGGTVINEQGYSARNDAGTAYVAGKYSDVPLGIGLHVYGSGNTVTQAADILTGGTGATGVRVDGMENTLVIPGETNIHADGLRGNGVLIAYGRDQVIDQAGTVTANGNGGTGALFDFGSSSNGAADECRGSYIRYLREVEAGTGAIKSSVNKKLTAMGPDLYNAAADELNGPLVKAYNLSGKLEGGGQAVYISENAFVKEINVNEGASVKGNIISDWKHFATDERVYDAVSEEENGLLIQYNGTAYDYGFYIPDLTTNLNFNTDMAYAYDIIGANNMKLNVNNGVLRYGGSANVVSVRVDEGAALLGGSYKVNDMTAMTAPGFSDSTTGKFINHGMIGAADRDSAMIIDGSLLSDGTLLGFAGGSAGDIRVTGNADIDGSDVKVADVMPDDNVRVLSAASIRGDTKTPAGTTYELSGMMNAKNEIKDGVLSVTAEAANNLNSQDPAHNETFDAMAAMDKELRENDDPRRGEMAGLFAMDAETAKDALASISSNAAAKNMAAMQRSTMTRYLLSSRLTEAFAQPENEFWLKFGRNRGDVRGGTDYHSSAALLGWDKAISPTWRAGLFAGHGKTSFADDSSNGKLKDTRFGIYAGFSNTRSEGTVYLNYGWMKNELRRGIAGTGLTAAADYDSRILELGGEYLFDLHAGKNVPWHVRPYINAQLSRLWQDGYSETGAGVFGQNVKKMHNDYFGAEAGVEFKRYLSGGDLALRAGVRHAFAGAEPKLQYSYTGDSTAAYEMGSVQDKTHFTLSIRGEAEFAKGWTIGGDAAYMRGSHDKGWFCAVTVTKVW